MVLGFLAFSTLSVLAGSPCSEVRIDQGHGSMVHVPVRSQGPLGTCYAEVAAQVVDAYRFSHGDKNFGRPTSSLMTALYFAEETKRDSFEGGFSCPALNLTANFGRCDELDLNKTLGRNSKFRLKSLIDGVLEFHHDYQEYSTAIDRSIAESQVRAPAQMRMRDKLESDRQMALEQKSAELIAYLSKSGVKQEIIPKKEYARFLLEQKSGVFFIKKLLTQACARNVKYLDVTPPQCQQLTRYKVGQKGLSERIDQMLSRHGALPVGVAYCSHVLERGFRYRGLASGHCRDHDDHASIVIGQRQNRLSHRCEYLVRNSWGTRCDRYSKDWTCERGNIWVDREAFLSNLKSISLFSPGEP